MWVPRKIRKCNDGNARIVREGIWFWYDRYEKKHQENLIGKINLGKIVKGEKTRSIRSEK